LETVEPKSCEIKERFYTDSGLNNQNNVSTFQCLFKSVNHSYL